LLQSVNPAWKNPPAIVVVAKVELAEMFKVVAARLVEVILVAEISVGLKLVTDNVVKKPLVEVTDVPEAEVNISGPVKVPPASGR
jgi:hypothetical protein